MPGITRRPISSTIPGGMPGKVTNEELDKAFGTSEEGHRPLPPRPREDPRMGVPEDWQMIHTLMARILADVGPVLKDQTNTHQNYNFRGIDQVVNKVNAAFKEHRVFLTSKIEHFALRDAMTTANKPTREATLRVVFRFHAPDGSFVETEVPGEALDTSDKTTPKAMSVALRIALLQMLLLPTTEPTTDHDYLTRDGVGAMSPTVSAYLLERLITAPLPEVVGPIRAMISEHSAWDRPVREDAATWAANFADRLSQIIDEAPDYPTLQDIHTVLDAARLLGATNGKGSMVDQLKARWMQLRDLYHGTLNHVTAQILAARGVDELDAAVGCGHAALEAGTLRFEDLEKAVAVAEERRPKLPPVAPQPIPAEEPAPTDAYDGIGEDSSPEDDEESEAIRGAIEAGARVMAEAASQPLDPTSSASIDAAIEREGQKVVDQREQERRRVAFVFRATQAPLAGAGEDPLIRERAVFSAIADLLTGEFSNDPASNHGAHGFQVVEDAIKAAHRREQTIGDGTRKTLDAMLAEHRALNEQVVAEFVAEDRRASRDGYAAS